MTSVRLIVCVGLGVMVAACACGSDRQAEPTSTKGVHVLVRTDDPESTGDAAIHGTLTVLPGECLGLRSQASGRPSKDLVVVWPRGTTITDDEPLTIRTTAATGASLVLRVGDDVSGSGGVVSPSTDGGPIPTPPAACDASDVAVLQPDP